MNTIFLQGSRLIFCLLPLVLGPAPRPLIIPLSLQGGEATSFFHKDLYCRSWARRQYHLATSRGPGFPRPQEGGGGGHYAYASL